MYKISFHKADRSIPILNRTAIKKFVMELFHSEKKPLHKLSYIFCSDEFVLEINRRHLRHDFYTDILTFCLSHPSKPIEAEIYLSIDRIEENAKTFNQTYQTELLRVIIHGALHLCGYEDKSSLQQKQMRRKENFYLHKFLQSFT